MTTLPEQLLLIALDDVSGKMKPTVSSYIHYGLAGAILMELTMRECLVFKNKNIVVLNKTDAGDKLLNDALQYIQSKRKAKGFNLTHLLFSLSTYLNRNKKYLAYMDRLVEQGILRKEQKTGMFFKTNIYPATNTKTEYEIREKVKQVVLSNDDNCDDKTVALISLIKACRLDRLVFTKEEYKSAKRLMKHMIKNDPQRKAVTVTIHAMEVAVIISVISIVITSSFLLSF